MILTRLSAVVQKLWLRYGQHNSTRAVHSLTMPIVLDNRAKYLEGKVIQCLVLSQNSDTKSSVYPFLLDPKIKQMLGCLRVVFCGSCSSTSLEYLTLLFSVNSCVYLSRKSSFLEQKNILCLLQLPQIPLLWSHTGDAQHSSLTETLSSPQTPCSLGELHLLSK